MHNYTSNLKRIKNIEQSLDVYLNKKNGNLPDPDLLKNNFEKFIEFFFPLVWGRPFQNRTTIGRPSYLETIIPVLYNVINHNPQYKRTYIASPPRYGKTTLMCFFVAWAWSKYPKSNFIYTSYAKDLSLKQTKLIKRIVSLAEYKILFGIWILNDFSASENFGLNTGGEIFGAGAEGQITGKGAGITGIDEFGGAIIIDDIHKPMEVTSDKYRESIKKWYGNTIVSRVNNPQKTPIIFIAQRLHEDDLPNNLITGKLDFDPWTPIILPALNEANVALMPEMHTAQDLLKMKEADPYNFAAQYQQNPVPAGGALFKEEWFYPLLEEIPNNIVLTFITADTAETTKNYNDATVFTFWGVYKIKHNQQETNVLGLHCIDCVELRIEPRDLEDNFFSFYSDCLRFPVKPQFAAIEKKSTGVTLLSVVQKMRGIEIRAIERSITAGSKSSRFIQMQPYIAQKKLTIHEHAKHKDLFIQHMTKITANDSHRHDDIADTCYDAIKFVYIDEAIKALIADKPTVQYNFRTPSTSTFSTWQK